MQRSWPPRLNLCNGRRGSPECVRAAHGRTRARPQLSSKRPTRGFERGVADFCPRLFSMVSSCKASTRSLSICGNPILGKGPGMMRESSRRIAPLGWCSAQRPSSGHVRQASIGYQAPRASRPLSRRAPVARLPQRVRHFDVSIALGVVRAFSPAPNDHIQASSKRLVWACLQAPTGGHRQRRWTLRSTQ